MPKIPAVSSKQFCALLEQAGCMLKRIEGDHYIYKKEGVHRPIVVPLRKKLPTYIVFNDLRTLGMTRAEFIRAMKEL